jgi:hypothetical protein
VRFEWAVCNRDLLSIVQKRPIYAIEIGEFVAFKVSEKYQYYHYGLEETRFMGVSAHIHSYAKFWQYGLKQSLANPDWTLISLGLFCILRVIWWETIDKSLSLRSSYLIECSVSRLVWIVALTSYLLSTAGWQKALCLQLELMLPPFTNHVMGTIRLWMVASQCPSWIINTPVHLDSQPYAI